MICRCPSAAIVLGLVLGVVPLRAQPFRLPTPNRAILEPGGETRYFAGTVGKPWRSGTFGCVRTEGSQLHEGWDILSLQKDRQGEPTDPVMATAAGTVAYINRNPALSNYGRYIILRHQVEGLEVYSSYSHLRAIGAGLAVGQAVAAGQTIGTLGRSANTREGISKDRAHLHFELALRLSDRFTSWQKVNFPEQRNDHGEFNGRNFIAIDPFQVFREQLRLRAQFSLVRLLQQQTELCRVVVRDTEFAWLRRYAPLVQPSPRPSREPVAGYEVSLNYHGLPFRLTPRTASELQGQTRFQVVSVNEAELKARPCGKLVAKRDGRWRLTATGERFLSLLTH